jgi:hypothetical protein
MGLEDFPLERTPPPRQSSERPSPSRWVILGAGTVVALALLGLWWTSRARLPEVTLAPTSPTDAARAPGRPNPQPLRLPPLAESDSELRKWIAALSRHPLLTRVLAQPGIVRAAVLAVVQIGDGKTPVVPLDAMRPADRLKLVGGSPSRIDPASYTRWNGPARALLDINAADAAQVYVNVKELFDEAYRDLGYPGGNFDDAIVRAIRMLVETPEVTGDPVLHQRPAYFEHEDPALGSLRPVQKQLLLTGPENRRQLIAWLRRFAAALALKID